MLNIGSDCTPVSFKLSLPSTSSLIPLSFAPTPMDTTFYPAMDQAHLWSGHRESYDMPPLFTELVYSSSSSQSSSPTDVQSFSPPTPLDGDPSYFNSYYPTVRQDLYLASQPYTFVPEELNYNYGSFHLKSPSPPLLSPLSSHDEELHYPPSSRDRSPEFDDLPTARIPSKRQRSPSVTSSSDATSGHEEEEGNNTSDSEYNPNGDSDYEGSKPIKKESVSKRRRKTATQARLALQAYQPPDALKRSILPQPIPVPYLTKKSRGRKVPVISDKSIDATPRGRRGKQAPDSATSDRAYKCEVEGCGKAFIRGEHLKRHVRSIHTHEKPHVCPYEGCGKSFNRKDNLGQHFKIHL